MCFDQEMIIVITLSFTICALIVPSFASINCPEHCKCSFNDGNDSLFTVHCSAIPIFKQQDMASKVSKLYLNIITVSSKDFLQLPKMINLRLLSVIGVAHTDDLAEISIKNLFPHLRIFAQSQSDIKQIPSLLPCDLSTLILSNNFITQIHFSSFSCVYNLKELLLDGNNLHKISINSFIDDTCSSECSDATKPLLQLKVLSLERNHITEIAPDSFNYMTSLQALNLGCNKLTSIDVSLFNKLSNLEILDISSNPLTHLPNGIFAELSSLKHLNLSNCQLHFFPRDLPLLEVLDLFNNSITTVSEKSKLDIYPIELFKLGGNPLHCDCNVAWLKDLYIRRQYILKYRNVAVSEYLPTCASPLSVKGKRWDLLNDDVFDCHLSDKQIIQNEHIQHRNSVELVVKLGQVTDVSIIVKWSYESLEESTVLFVVWYVFGQRKSTSRHVEISADMKQYTLRRLSPTTNYVVCILPKTSDSEPITSLTLKWCVEATTKEREELPDIGTLRLVVLYILVMVGTLAGLFLFITAIAVISSWFQPATIANPEVCIDEPLIEKTASASSKSNPVTSSVRSNFVRHKSD